MCVAELSAFHTAAGDALYEVFLQRQEQKHRYDGRYGRACKNVAEVYRVLILEIGQRYLDCPEFFRPRHQQRPEEVIPFIDKYHQPCRDRHRNGQGQYDFRKYLQPVGSVDARRFQKALRNFLEKTG